MTRRELIRQTCAGAAAAGALRPLLAGSQIAYREYSSCLPDFLSSLAAEAYQRRKKAIAQLSTPVTVRRRAEWARKTFWQLIGGRPERTPLNARTVGTLERDGYRIEKVIYESRPNFPIAANLYVPTSGKPPYPGVLFQMGHSANGKAMGVYQACCLGLVKLGFVVLGFDPMGQGERIYYPGSDPTVSRTGSADDEHTMPAFQMMLVGDTATRWQTWDSVRSLDYLASHPLVDSKRLATTGQSGGGTTSMFLACADDRLAAAVIASGNTENFACGNFIAPGSTDDAEQDLVNSVPAGFDRWDMLHAFAPKPLLVMASAHDFFGTYSPNYLHSGREEFGLLRGLYQKLGRASEIEWYESPMPHGLAYDFRLQIYNWFGRFLLSGFQRITEEPAAPREADRDLWVTPSGSLLRDLHSATPFSIVRQQPVAPKPQPLEALLKVDRPPATVEGRTLARVRFASSEIEALEVPSAPNVWVTTWLFQPRGKAADAPVLVALSNDARAQWREGGLWDSLAAQGFITCPVDVRGVGDLRPNYGWGNPPYEGSHQDENQYAWASLILGKPLVGQRVTDILAVVAALRNRPGFKRRKVVLAARGPLVVPALFAAALDAKIEALHLDGGLVSFRNLVDTELYVGGRYERNGNREANNAINVAFGLLQSTDLPQVAASIAPRKLVLAGAIDAAGAVLSEAHVRAVYASAANVEVRPSEPWTPESLAAWLG